MKKILYLFVIVIFLSNCSKDEPSISSNDQILDGGIIMTSEIVQIENQNLTKETYEGDINGVPVSLGKSDENTLVFIVTSEFALGNVILNIESLNLKINYTIQQTVLDNSVEETIQEFISKLQTSTDSIEDSEQQNKAQEMVTSFTNYYNSLSDNEKLAAAEYYNTNKVLLQTAIDGNFSRLKQNNLTKFTQCKAGIYLTGVLGVITSLTSATGFGAVVGIVTGTAAGITLGQTIIHCVEASKSKIKSIFLNANNEIDVYSRSSNHINLYTENSKTITFSIGNRAIQTSDSNDENIYISEIFNWVNDLNSKIIVNLNSAIEGWNNFAPSFFSLKPYESIVINNDSEVQIFELTQELYNNLSFSISNDNIEIQNLSFTDGGIELKLKIIDIEIVTDDFIEATLDFTYNDDFNNFSGSFPLKIFKTCTNLNDIKSQIVGSWSVNIITQEAQNDPTNYPWYDLEMFENGTGEYTVDGTKYQMTWSVYCENGNYYFTDYGFWHRGGYGNEISFPLNNPITEIITEGKFTPGEESRKFIKR
ncbi:hypothetical protein [Tenacibaculum soleae]|uniref:hypothetical protein n=1 Tax=Tenacibaculum soleae TaxID=447689 RepID=UPI002301401E|nr:hypothetical protein [Tenacibaculum soleae]